MGESWYHSSDGVGLDVHSRGQSGPRDEDMHKGTGYGGRKEKYRKIARNTGEEIP